MCQAVQEKIPPSIDERIQDSGHCAEHVQVAAVLLLTVMCPEESAGSRFYRCCAETEDPALDWNIHVCKVPLNRYRKSFVRNCLKTINCEAFLF